jgi:serine/threonine protein kinase
LLDHFYNNLVLEFAPGGRLREFMENHGGNVELKVAIRIMRELAEGLIQIHGKGVIHGDIKGRNILLMGDPTTWNSKDPLIKYADFGEAVSGTSKRMISLSLTI